ncbi:MAG: PH domain-containing protein [Asgard group archaeon]|nr:PH domain-containing protein [Asgard group archaeon]
MIKEEITFKPHGRFLHKRNIVAFFTVIVIFGVTILIGYFDKDIELDPILWYLMAAIFPTILVGWIIFNVLYFKSIQYKIEEHEIVIQRGVLHKKVKVVPFQSITNITVSRDPIDRIFYIGSVKIQTAGYSGEKTPELKIEGITNYNEIYDKVMISVKLVSRITPLKAEEKLPVEVLSTDIIEIRKAILQEFIEIKELIGKRKH